MSCATRPSSVARALMPLNINASRITITVSTRRALRHSTGLNAITLSLIALIPVRAAQPELKARISSTGPNAASEAPCSLLSRRFCSASGTAVSDPWLHLISPATTRVNTAPMNRKVGRLSRRAVDRTPRRLASISKHTATRHNGSRSGPSWGKLGGECGDAGCHSHRHGEHVIDRQRSGGTEAGDHTEVVV